jgi:abortive infection bacteriophage resistance protein
MLSFHSYLSGHSADFSLQYPLPLIDKQLRKKHTDIARKIDVNVQSFMSQGVGRNKHKKIKKGGGTKGLDYMDDSSGLM